MKAKSLILLLALSLMLPSCHWWLWGDWDAHHHHHASPPPAPHYHGHTGFRNNFRPAPPRPPKASPKHHGGKYQHPQHGPRPHGHGGHRH